jgi:hypothetical protein
MSTRTATVVVAPLAAAAATRRPRAPTRCRRRTAAAELKDKTFQFRDTRCERGILRAIGPAALARHAWAVPPRPPLSRVVRLHLARRRRQAQEDARRGAAPALTPMPRWLGVPLSLRRCSDQEAPRGGRRGAAPAR